MARKILLADDSVTAQNMGRKILTDAGYEVVTVNNGSAALKKIAEHKPDLIVLDVYMPGYSGLEVCQRIKENKETSRIPILLTVGKLEPFKPEEARRARADAFVVKPFEASELLTALTKLEDKIVPQAEPYKQGRFARAMAAVDSDNESGEKFGDTDGGWKDRLRFPSVARKSRDAEPDVDYAATQGKGVCDLSSEDIEKKRKSRAAAPEFERAVPAGLPHDITAEEIAAITAAAAQLSGPPASTVSQETSEPSASEALVPEPPAEDPGPVTFASSPTHEDVGAADETESPTITATAEVFVPAEIAVIAEPPQPPLAAIESIPEQGAMPSVAETQTQTTEPAETEETFPVVQAVKETPEVDVGQTADAQPLTAGSAEEVTASGSAPSDIVALAPAASSEAPPAQAATDIPELPSVEPSPPPAEDEFMTALQSLMPATGSVSMPSSPAKEEEMPAALAAIVAEVDSRMVTAHPAGSRWIAEKVALAASEATLSLQKEMEQAYAAFAAADGFQLAAVSAPTTTVVVAEPVAESVVATAASELVEQHSVLAMAAAAADTGATVAGVQTPAGESAIAGREEVRNQTETIREELRADTGFEEAVMPESQIVAESAAMGSTSSEVASDFTQHQNEIVGGTEDMAANWKNIRDSIAGAATKPALARDEVREIEVAPAQAEAVADESKNAPSISGAADPRAIANIVDSVLAELRPKIVEEIAKKLADPKKS